MKNMTRIAITTLALIIASPAAFASTGKTEGAEASAATENTENTETAEELADHPVKLRQRRKARRRVVRRQVVRRPRVRRRVIRRTRVVHAPPRTVVRRTVVHSNPGHAMPASPRASRPVQVSLLQKNTVTGVELGVRIGPFIEIHGGAGIDLMPQPVTGCRGPGCATENSGKWNTGVRFYPMNTRLAPFVSLGAMGSFTDIEDTRALVGVGVGFQAWSGLNLNASIEYAIAEEAPEQAVIGTVTVGYAF